MQSIRWMKPIAALLLTGWVTTAVTARATPEVTGAGAGPFPAGTTFNLVSLEGLQFGLGAGVGLSGVGSGDLHVTLLGTSAAGTARQIIFDGTVLGIAVAQGIATVFGTGTQDMGDGAAPISGVPFTATVTANTLVLVLGPTTLPLVTLTQGMNTIK